jgi:hypothetical protein
MNKWEPNGDPWDIVDGAEDVIEVEGMEVLGVVKERTENAGVAESISQMERGERIVFGDVDVDEAGHRRT